MQKLRLGIILFALSMIHSQCYSDAGAEQKEHPKNIILLIGDGMGMAQIYSGMTMNKGRLSLEKATHIGIQKTNSSNNYITDSAASGTAIASGVKTKNGVVGKDSTMQDVKSLLEYAEENGLATGLVSTSAITHATPASFIAHVESRNMYEDIAAFFLKTDIDVFIGGGKAHFETRKDSVNLLPELEQNGYKVVSEIQELSLINNGKLAALIAEGHLPSILDGRGDMLPVATNTAMRILNNDEDGFFLMIEGSQIDWGAHANNTDYVATEMIDFDKAIKEAIDFAEKDGETLVVITADHETGGMSIVGGDVMEGKVMANYGTTGHTSVMVPVFAFGPGSEVFSGVYENTEIFEKMMYLYGFQKTEK